MFFLVNQIDMVPFDLDLFRTLVRREIARHGLRGLARKLDLKVGTIQSIQEGKEPRASVAAEILEKLGVGLFFGTDKDHAPVAEVSVDDESFVAIPRYAVQASAGGGLHPTDTSIIGSLAFSRPWLLSKGINPTNTFLIDVSGDSMEPELRDGDLVLVDRAQLEPDRRNVMAFVDVDGAVRLKRLERLEEQLILLSDNSSYPTEVRDHDEGNRIEIIGQVVWSGHSWS